MLAGLVFAAALAAGTATPPPVVVNGRAPVAAKVNVGSSDDNAIDLVAVWPMAAYGEKDNGRVTLSCWIDAHGLAESCRVASESPAGRGFGAAALQMRPTFKLTPAKGPDGPVGSTMTIAINFKAPDTHFDFYGVPPQGAIAGCGGLRGPCPEWHASGNPLQMRPVTMLDRPIWATAASFEELARAYPAQANGVEGYAVDHCQVLPDGTLTKCQTIAETPEKLGFGKAALALAARFRVAPGWTKAPDRGELWTDVPIRFEPPAATAPRRVEAPIWVAGVDPDSAPKVYPPEAVAKGVSSGVGVARCKVAADGELTDCMPGPADPDGLGFSDAAARLASVMKMNPWTADAAPVDGAEVDVHIQLNLAGGG